MSIRYIVIEAASLHSMKDAFELLKQKYKVVRFEDTLGNRRSHGVKEPYTVYMRTVFIEHEEKKK